MTHLLVHPNGEWELGDASLLEEHPCFCNEEIEYNGWALVHHGERDGAINPYATNTYPYGSFYIPILRGKLILQLKNGTWSQDMIDQVLSQWNIWPQRAWNAAMYVFLSTMELLEFIVNHIALFGPIIVGILLWLIWLIY